MGVHQEQPAAPHVPVPQRRPLQTNVSKTGMQISEGQLTILSRPMFIPQEHVRNLDSIPLDTIVSPQTVPDIVFSNASYRSRQLLHDVLFYSPKTLNDLKVERDLGWRDQRAQSSEDGAGWWRERGEITREVSRKERMLGNFGDGDAFDGIDREHGIDKVPCLRGNMAWKVVASV